MSKRVFQFTAKAYKWLRFGSRNSPKITSKSEMTQGPNVEQTNSQLMLRYLSSDSKDRPKESKYKFEYELPPLMFLTPEDIGLPFMTPFKINFYFKPYIDKNFDVKAFLLGAKRTLTDISTNLANDNIQGIKKLVTNKAFEEIQENYGKYSSEQKQKLRVNAEDIHICFPYSIAIDRQSPDLSEIKIVVFFQILADPENVKTGLKETAEKESTKFYDIMSYTKLLEPAVENLYFCFYQFSRQYETGVQSEWKVCKMAHYKNKDIWRLDGLVS